MRALFAARGCTLLEHEYTGTKQVMRYLCPALHERTVRFDHFVGGHSCALCRNERRWNGRRLDLDAVLLAIEDEGFTDVEVTRDEGRIRVTYTCAAGHRSETTHAHFVEGKRCRDCWGLSQRGPQNPRYNHTLTAEDRQVRRKYEAYGEWRRAVFARDAYKCRCCGEGGRLNAHHIVNYSAAPELRTAVDNGITLCVGCHRGFHAEHGYRNNSAVQLISFMERTSWA